jgi:cell division initiation protein
MRISPIDIQQKQFKSRPFGYEKAGVDQFLETLAEEIERLVRQNQDLEEELARVRATLAEMRDREATLKETLMTTQKLTDELKSTARREVEVILADAELRAERVMRNAEDRRIQLIEEIQEIKRQKIDFEGSLRSLLEKHVRMLELNTVALEESAADAKLLEEPLPFDDNDSEPFVEEPADNTIATESANTIATESAQPVEPEQSPEPIAAPDLAFDFDLTDDDPDDQEPPAR